MNTLRELFVEPPPAVEQPRITPIRERICEEVQPRAIASSASVHDEQIHGLVRQLFFRNESRPVRHVGFAPAEISIATATLCLAVARALAEEGRYDVGLVDAGIGPDRLETELQVAPPPSRVENPWPLAPRLWMAPRQIWLPDASGGRVSEQNLARLRETTAEFDFSVLWCAPVSWLTAGIGQNCDGLVLVLAAERTRRVVAARIKDQLGKAGVPLLGSVLAGRRFPVPQGLYRRL